RRDRASAPPRSSAWRNRGSCHGRAGASPPAAGFPSLPAAGSGSPVARRRNPLTGGDGGGMTNQGDQLPAASYPNPNDAKATLGVLVGDTLDQSREHLAVRGFGVDLHEPRHSVGYPISKHRTGRKSC